MQTGQLPRKRFPASWQKLTFTPMAEEEEEGKRIPSSFKNESNLFLLFLFRPVYTWWVPSCKPTMALSFREIAKNYFFLLKIENIKKVLVF